MLMEESLRTNRIRHLSPKVPVGVPPETPLPDTVALMRGQGIGCVLVTRDGKLAGIFTERDLLLKVLIRGHQLTGTVGDYMTPDPLALEQDAPISEAILAMHKGGYRHVPVVDETGRPVGIISTKDITDYIVEHYPVEIYNLPPDPEQNSLEDGGA